MIQNNEFKLKKFNFANHNQILFDCDNKITIEFIEDGSCIIDIFSYRCCLTKKVNSSITNNILKLLEDIKIESWKRKYKPVNMIILDGESWNIKLEYFNGKKIYRSGDNMYPDNYNQLEELIVYVYDCVENVVEK